MPDSFVQVAPDSTGKMLHTRSRAAGTNTVQDQYVIALQSEAVPINRVWVASQRIPARVLAGGATQNLFTVYNGNAVGGYNVSVRRLSVEIDTATAYAVTGPLLRLHRVGTAPTGGTVLTPVQQYSADLGFSSTVSVRADHQGDNVVATTALGATGLIAQPLWSQTVPRMQASGGFYVPTEFNMMPNDSSLNAVDPLILRPAEGALVQLTMGPTATTVAGHWTFMVKAVLAEFTYP